MLPKLPAFILFVLLTQRICAQPIQRFPENGKDGYNGSTPRSYIVEWDSLSGAAYYEYVITDNSLCFLGCSGDTRMDQVAATHAVERNLVQEKWYYWIVRAYMKNGDTSFFSPIHSFYTRPRPEDSRSFFTLCPNLITEGTMDIQAVWNIDPDITHFSYKVYTTYGELLITSEQFTLIKSELEETELFPVRLTSLTTGMYFVEITTNISKAPERLKLLISQ
jgi:hypothetical protein